MAPLWVQLILDFIHEVKNDEPAVSPYENKQSLPQQVSEWLKVAIQNGEWSNKLPGERSLAARFKVNRKTCTAALSIAEKQGWISAAMKGRRRTILLDSQRPRQPQEKYNRLLFIEQKGLEVNIEDRQLLRKMVASWKKRNRTSVTVAIDYRNFQKPGRKLKKLISDHQIDAILLQVASHQWISAATSLLPTFIVGGSVKDAESVCGVCYSVEAEIVRVVKSLVTRGQRKILIPIDYEDVGGRGIKHAIKTLEKEHVDVEISIPIFAENSPVVWQSYWDSAIQAHLPSAVIVLSEAHLISFYGFCARSGLRIPEDISVLCLDHTERMKWMWPIPDSYAFPAQASIRHFNRWVDSSLTLKKYRKIPLIYHEGKSVKDLGDLN